ncbi:protein S17 [Seminavis robusta]|uniref:Protein S17 n=1 Tax=Seminavis robusta TaxID=568900 RepID=A0A9N8H7B8_9STRA|nr:protein S17 [Seminavis robusta]|eukprot:Sro174_g076510.1 protein S17 (165) ;mRNA; f:9207-9701
MMSFRILSSQLHQLAIRASSPLVRNAAVRSFSVTSPCFQSSTATSSSRTLLKENFSEMTNEELMETSTIPGWDLIHSPPGKMPRGALVGTVVSTKMQKTVNVAVDRYRMVPKIRKRVKYTRKFMAHDENEVANLGDIVMITPCHRISKMKHFLLRTIVRPKGQL